MHRIYFLLAITLHLYNGGWCFVRTQNDPLACSLDVDNKLIKKNQPVMVLFDGNKYSLTSPEKKQTKSVINVSPNNKIILVCPGVDNEISTARQNTVVTTCNRRDELQFERGKQLIAGTDKFVCKKQITPQIKNMGQTCGENSQSTLFEIGFSVDSIDRWFPTFTVCHDVLNMNTLYSTHTIEGKSITARQKNVPRPPKFMEGNLSELYEGGSPNTYYSKEYQVQIFQALFETENINDYVDVYLKFLSRGHLTPDADMTLSYLKVATYMFINVVPQWQMINAGNWLKVENDVRDAASWSQDDFTIITGAYGVMKLRIGSTEREIYLAPGNKLRVPEQLWKIVYHKKSQKAIVIITSNNPYKKVQPLCTDVCKTYGWWRESFQQDNNLRRGLTYCCTYKDFKQIVTYAPSLAVLGTYAMPKEPPRSRFRTAVKRVMKNNAIWKKKEKRD